MRWVLVTKVNKLLSIRKIEQKNSLKWILMDKFKVKIIIAYTVWNSINFHVSVNFFLNGTEILWYWVPLPPNLILAIPASPSERNTSIPTRLIFLITLLQITWMENRFENEAKLVTFRLVVSCCCSQQLTQIEWQHRFNIYSSWKSEL